MKKRELDLPGQQTVPATLGTVMSEQGNMALRSQFELSVHSEARMAEK